MGCWDIFCIVCGLPPNFIEFNIEKEDLLKLGITDKEYRKRLRWLKRSVFLISTNQVIKNCEEVGCNIHFRSKNKKSYVATVDSKEFIKYYSNFDNFGYFIHDDCYKYVKKYHKIDLKLGDFYLDKGVSDVRGDVSKYWDQYFNIFGLIKDNNFWMAESPFKNRRNAKRIDKIVRQLKIRPGRSGPTISASFYRNGTIKIGNDGYFWEIKNKKWVRIANKPMKEVIDFDDKIFLKTPTIAFTNTKPIFIYDFDYKKMTIIKI